MISSNTEDSKIILIFEKCSNVKKFQWLCASFKCHFWNLSFPDSSVGKESTCNAENPALIPESGRYPREGIGSHTSILELPLWFSRQRTCLQCRRPGFDFWVGKIPWRRERLPTPVLWLGEFLGPRQSNKTDWLSLWNLKTFPKLILIHAYV